MSSHRYGELSGHNSGSLSERQDSMFDRYLEEMKPYVLRLPQKSGKLIKYKLNISSDLTEFPSLVTIVSSDAVIVVAYFCYLFVKGKHKR